MKLNHINLTVTDVKAASAFLKHIFGCEDDVDQPRNLAKSVMGV